MYSALNFQQFDISHDHIWKNFVHSNAGMYEECVNIPFSNCVVLDLSEGTSAKLPKLDNLKRTIQRQREKDNAAPAQPTSLEELVIPLEYTKTGKGDIFLLYDSGPHLHRILIFGTHHNIEMLAASQVWLADGTFKTAPALFGQVFVIHGLRGGPELIEDGHLLPSLFVLLPNKTQDTYMRMWQQIQLLCPNAQPTHMLMDFELAAIKSFQGYSPNTNVKGCFFHLTQNIWRKVQAEGLQADYNQNEEFALKIRLLPALAYASPFDVPELFADVVQQLPMPAAQGLVLYFERTYIGRTLPGGTFRDPLPNRILESPP